MRANTHTELMYKNVGGGSGEAAVLQSGVWKANQKIREALGEEQGQGLNQVLF